MRFEKSGIKKGLLSFNKAESGFMNITGSFDHRIIDGAYGAQFLQELKMLMENPCLMLY